MSFSLPEGRPAVMGVLNVTPDSFSDGGLFLDPEAAIAHGVRLRDEGADLVDVGGESTRPGADPVPLEEELRRVLPVVRALAARGVAVSIDTTKPEVARQSLLEGAVVVNDLRALIDPIMVEVCAAASATVCLMHMKGDPKTMQVAPTYRDVVAEVRDDLAAAAHRAAAGGVARERIWLDPGIGFGKDLGHNLSLLRHLDEIVALGYPVLVGVSRKSFIGRLVGSPVSPAPVEMRSEGTIAAQTLAQAKGARVLRTHDVAAAVRAARVVQGVLNAR